MMHPGPQQLPLREEEIMDHSGYSTYGLGAWLTAEYGWLSRLLDVATCGWECAWRGYAEKNAGRGGGGGQPLLTAQAVHYPGPRREERVDT